jgi:ABC-2 type transport system permease protein
MAEPAGSASVPTGPGRPAAGPRAGGTGTAGRGRPRRALPLRAELRRQLRRRRTKGVGWVVLLLPLLLVGAFALGQDDSGSGQRGFVDLAQESGANLTVFTLFASTGFLLIVVVALFAGDAVPAEASWSSLRYLLAAPVPRGRLLQQKLVVAALSSLTALVLLPAWTLLVGGVAYGWGPYVGPTGDQIGWPDFALRLLVIVAFLAVELTVVGALAFAIGVFTDAPLAAVGGAVFTTVVFAVLEAVEQLGDIRDWFPTAFSLAWTDLLQTPVDSGDLFRGVVQSLVYAAVFTALAFRHFSRRDVTS